MQVRTAIILSFILTILSSSVMAQEPTAAGSRPIFLEFQDLDWAEPTAEPTEVPIRPRQDSILYGLEREKFNTDGFVLRNTLPSTPKQVSLRSGVSDTKVEYRNLKPDELIEQEILLNVSSPESMNYQVMVGQEQLLQNDSGNTISATTCDEPCSTTNARPWTRSAAYGFGFSMSGRTVPADFQTKSAYRSFPLISSQGYVPIMYRYVLLDTDQSIMRLKVNVPPSFQQNTYSAIIRVIAFPKP